MVSFAEWCCLAGIYLLLTGVFFFLYGLTCYAVRDRDFSWILVGMTLIFIGVGVLFGCCR